MSVLARVCVRVLMKERRRLFARANLHSSRGRQFETIFARKVLLSAGVRVCIVCKYVTIQTTAIVAGGGGGRDYVSNQRSLLFSNSCLCVFACE